MWKKIVSVGEQKLNELATQVLSNEALIEGVQDMMKVALNARKSAVTTVKTALKLVNVPSLDDIQRLQTKLDEIEQVFADVRQALDERDRTPK
ncbi:MAG: hypothetical protein IT381_22065 [Deltaproteobacteria bacterium]|nr:hypothetical protein [Deltaproteobacteria bacterium]